MNFLRSVGAAWLLATVGIGPVVAQQVSWDPRRVRVSREDLTELLDRLDKAAASTAYSDTLRGRAQAQGALIRARLQDGDFQQGDRIALLVEGEVALSDTFTVSAGPVLPVTQIGDIPLNGVLRSELEAHIKKYLARFIKEPKVTARSLIRIAVIGGVGKTGFYSVPSEMLLSDVLMTAGGPAATAKLSVIEVLRGERRIWRGDALIDSTAGSRSLDQLGVRAGDRINVPEKSAMSGYPGGAGGGGLSGRGGFGGLGRGMGVFSLLALPLTILGLVRLL